MLRACDLKLGGLYSGVTPLYVRTSAPGKIVLHEGSIIKPDTLFMLVNKFDEPDEGKIRTFYVILTPKFSGWFDCLGNDNVTWSQRFKRHDKP